MKHGVLLSSLCIIPLLLVHSCDRQRWEDPVPGQTVIPAITLTAGFESDESPAPQVRSTLSMNEEGTAAFVTWTAGDRFVMIRGGEKAVFSTEESGRRVTFSTPSTLPSSGTCVSLYPEDKHLSDSGSSPQTAYGMMLPSVQTAVPGGIEEGLNLSVACSTNPEADLVFRNVLSYIRFRLSGEATRAVRAVILEAGKTIAGDLTLTGIQRNAPTVSFGRDWTDSKVAKSTRIRLEGPFTPGQDYFIALAPVLLDGFEMLFENEDGLAIRKRSTLTLDLNRSKVYDFGTLPLGDDFPGAAHYQEEAVTYQQAKAGRKPVVLCVIPEAFREEELPQYDSLARRFLDFLFDTEPYRSYRDYFTAHILKVPSAESGAAVSGGSKPGKSHDTSFNAYWGSSSYSNMDANEYKIWGFVSRNCPEIRSGTHTLSEVMILMIIHDARYAGITHSYSNGRSYAMVPYSYDGGAIRWHYPANVPNGNEGPEDGYHTRTEADYEDIGQCVGDWRYTAVHEFGGHAFGRLSDEYWGTSYSETPQALKSQSWTVPYGLNITHLKNNPPWKEPLLDTQAALVARDPNYGRIGVFQGAGENLFNKWRSEKISCMTDCRPYFSTWQRILIVQRIMRLAGAGFSWEEFWEKDVTADPIRDLPQTSPSALPQADKPAPIDVPPLPPPVLHDVDQDITLERR